MSEIRKSSDQLNDYDDTKCSGWKILHLSTDGINATHNTRGIPLPDGWLEELEKSTGITAYVHKTSGRRTYIDPRMPFPQRHVRKMVQRRFTANATALEIASECNLSGKVAIITGANNGIGYETARALALNGCHVYLACRSETSALEAIDRIRVENNHAAERCAFVQLDLASLRSVRNCATQLQSLIQHVDILVLNAGVFGMPYKSTTDGVETTFQVCHLGHFYLTALLDDCLDYRSRVVIVSSYAHILSLLPTNNLREADLSPPAAEYNSVMAYNDAKLCNILYGIGLAKRLHDRGVCVHSLHPGNFVTSGIARHSRWAQLWFKIVNPFTKSLEQAAATVAYCAAAPELNGITGQYHEDCYLSKANSRSQNERMADKLWTISEEMIKRILTED